MFLNLASVLLKNSYQIMKERDRVTFVMEGHQSNKYVFKLKLNNPSQNVAPASLQIHVFDSLLCLHPSVLLTLPWTRCTPHASLFTYGFLCPLLPNYYVQLKEVNDYCFSEFFPVPLLTELSIFSFVIQLEFPHISMINLNHNCFHVFMQPPGCVIFKRRFHILFIFVYLAPAQHLPHHKHPVKVSYKLRNETRVY